MTGRDDGNVWMSWLAMIDSRIQGVTRLDQQLVYVPLVGTAGAVYAVAAQRGEFQSIGMSTWVVPMYGFVIALVCLGLIRNHVRHWQLERARRRALVRLGIERTPAALRPSRRRVVRLWRRLIRFLLPLDVSFALGRPVFFGLFVVGFSFACVALLRLLA